MFNNPLPTNVCMYVCMYQVQKKKHLCYDSNTTQNKQTTQCKHIPALGSSM